jgi:hypothetical protein
MRDSWNPALVEGLDHVSNRFSVQAQGLSDGGALPPGAGKAQYPSAPIADNIVRPLPTVENGRFLGCDGSHFDRHSRHMVRHLKEKSTSVV